MSYKMHWEYKSKIGHASGRLPMSSAHSMNAIKCVHAQKPYPSQAFTHKLSKVGGRGKRETGKQS